MMNSIIAGPFILLNLFLLGISIYCLILFIRLAHRGIKALDIYISKEKTRGYETNGYVTKDENKIE